MYVIREDTRSNSGASGAEYKVNNRVTSRDIFYRIQYVIRANILSCAETIAYLCQRMFNGVRNYLNVRSTDFCYPMLSL